MLFRDNKGKLININRLDYLNDNLFISEILKIFDNKMNTEIKDIPISVIINNFLKENNIPNINN